MTQSFKKNYWFWIFLIVWVAINLLQAFTTELSHDEAYYWMYSRHLSWGYFDHPPAIAVAIKAGYFFFKSELGVRLIPVLLTSGTIYFIYRICQPESRQQSIFVVLIFSIPLVHVGGFFATPDIPMIFFTTAYLFLFKRYLGEDSPKNALILGVLMALLLYSKYHGILVIAFTVFANPYLLKRKTFWLSAILGALLFLPHLFWQYSNDWPSFKYHLFERSREPYKIEFSLFYLLSQLILAGAPSGLLLFYLAGKIKTSKQFDKTLKILLVGILIFFFLSSFKSRIEANWTTAAFIPLIILSFEELRKNNSLRRWMFFLAFPSILAIIGLRVLLSVNTLPFDLKFTNEFHHWREWAEQIKEKSAGAPVVFMNSYQKASKYTFYTGSTAHSLNNLMYRKNQYDLWSTEDSLQAKRIFIIPNWDAGMDSFRTVFGNYHNYTFVENFRSFNKIKIKAIERDLKFKARDSVRTRISLKNTGSYFADFLSNPNYPSQLAINFYKEGIFHSTQYLPLAVKRLKVGQEVILTIRFIAPDSPGRYEFRVAIATGWLPSGLNSDLSKAEVVEKGD